MAKAVCETHSVFIHLELVEVRAGGVVGLRVDPLGADLEQFPHQHAHLRPLAE